MFGWARILLTIVGCVLVTPVAAQAPGAGATTFDGKYVGTATITNEPRYGSSCALIRAVEMTITGGQVMIHEILVTGAERILHVNVSEAGEVSASLPRATVSGTIRDKVFTGQRLFSGGGGRGHCSYSLQMTKA